MAGSRSRTPEKRQTFERLRAELERAIVGALRAAIHDHGPITLENISSATKRILGGLKNTLLELDS